MMFMMTSCTCKVLQRVGVRKVVEIQPDESLENAASKPFAWSDGKNDGLVDVAYCSYSERYLDSSSDKVLYEKNWPKAMITLQALKGAKTEGAAAKFCTQCGAPISLSGDFYHCGHCGAHYESDAYEWTVTGLQPQNMEKDKRMSNLLNILILGTLGLAVVAIAANFTLLHVLVYLLNAFMVGGMAWFLYFAKVNLKGVQKCQEHDPLFSRQAFQRRAEYLYRLYNQAKDMDLSLIQPFMNGNWIFKYGRQDVRRQRHAKCPSRCSRRGRGGRRWNGGSRWGNGSRRCNGGTRRCNGSRRTNGT